MINDTLNETKIFEALGCVYNVTIIKNFTPENVERIKQLWESYSGGKLRENYTTATLQRMLVSQRFDLGFFIFEREGQPIMSFGLTLFGGWAIGTRFIRHSNSMEPFAAAVAVPFLRKYLDNSILGLAVTYNINERRTPSLINENPDRVFVYKNIPKEAMKDFYDFKELDYDVLYRNTRQKVFYAPYKEGAKPTFVRYNGTT
jgi:hypothetical protein